MLTGQEIRRRFLDYFAERGHEIVPSSSVVPVSDPTLLFSNAGMNQFKEVFLGIQQRPYERAVSSQKCVRAGGKHNDLENVGHTARHHTFFEMLGNFSFGDYFKKDAIAYAWEFLTRDMGLDPKDLYVTIYKDDDEAASLWRDITGLPPSRIIRLGEKDNVWSLGETGPCGPCSEIVIDRGPETSCDRPDCGIETCGCDRWLELWNLVFMQYNRDETGKLRPLPKPSIDTGMGLERITAVKQNAPTNFDTDLFMPIIRLVERLSGKKYGGAGVPLFPFRIIADHGRACVFMIADGVLPSNEGRGYVLRRVFRRAVRYGKILGIDDIFMHHVVPVVIDIMGEAYPDLGARAELASRVMSLEEKRFRNTLAEGTRRVEELIAQTKSQRTGSIAGKDAFLLYDTYGFPIDLTEDMAAEAGLGVDRSRFERAMEEQRERARAARHVEGTEALTALAKELDDVPTTSFVGYDRLQETSRVAAILVEGGRAPSAGAGQRASIIVEKTPFYSESGGQTGDQGTIRSKEGLFQVESTHAVLEGRVLHEGVVVSGGITEGDEAYLTVDVASRMATMRNHSATHLVHRSLRLVLGDHVNQAGSLVTPSRLRFDFTHFSALSPDEIRRTEDIANAQVLAGLAVAADTMSLDDAKRRGATSLFGEKYGAQVRVVRMGDFGMELCGGTHVRNTGEIGLVKIVSESSVGSGLRRIEAVTGMGALEHLRSVEGQLAEVASALKAAPQDAANRVLDLVEKVRDQAREIETLRLGTAKSVADSIAERAVDEKGVHIAGDVVDLPSIDAMRSLGDLVRDRLEAGVVILGATIEDKAALVVMASKEAVARGIHAGRIAKEAAMLVGGNGGGRPDMAQAGGKDVSQLGAAVAGAVKAARSLVS
ncbi:MAG: alanine--tRNA ligase [Bacillota bacterium]|nr:alanine--tRNA ligase [Bacillota bacterium]